MRDKNRGFRKLYIKTTKSIRFDDFTYQIINNYRGNNFSEKLRNYVFDTENQKSKK